MWKKLAQVWREDEEELDIDSDCEPYLNYPQNTVASYFDDERKPFNQEQNESYFSSESGYNYNEEDQFWFNEEELLEAYPDCHVPTASEPYYFVTRFSLEISFLAPKDPCTLPVLYFSSSAPTANLSPVYSVLQQLQEKTPRVPFVEMLHLVFDCFESECYFIPTTPPPSPPPPPRRISSTITEATSYSTNIIADKSQYVYDCYVPPRPRQSSIRKRITIPKHPAVKRDRKVTRKIIQKQCDEFMTTLLQCPTFFLMDLRKVSHEALSIIKGKFQKDISWSCYKLMSAKKSYIRRGVKLLSSQYYYSESTEQCGSKMNGESVEYKRWLFFQERQIASFIGEIHGQIRFIFVDMDNTLFSKTSETLSLPEHFDRLEQFGKTVYHMRYPVIFRGRTRHDIIVEPECVSKALLSPRYYDALAKVLRIEGNRQDYLRIRCGWINLLKQGTIKAGTPHDTNFVDIVRELKLTIECRYYSIRPVFYSNYTACHTSDVYIAPNDQKIYNWIRDQVRSVAAVSVVSDNQAVYTAVPYWLDIGVWNVMSVLKMVNDNTHHMSTFSSASLVTKQLWDEAHIAGPFNGLPMELMYVVFEYVLAGEKMEWSEMKKKEKLRNIASVNRYWYEVATDHEYWSRVFSVSHVVEVEEEEFFLGLFDGVFD